MIDDSVIVRRLLARVLDGEPDFHLAGEAGDGRAAMASIRTLRPEVVVLDLQMPGMSGFEVLEAMRTEGLTSRVVVFANVEADDRGPIAAAVEAAGAELVVKPVGVSDAEQAVARIRQCLLGPLRRGATRPDRPRSTGRRAIDAVVIASSTGGPVALEKVLSGITELRVPILIVQHIADGFSGRLADRLDVVTPFLVHEAVDGTRPLGGEVFVGPGGAHLTIERDAMGPVLRLSDQPPVNSCRPSADVLFQSSAGVYGANQLGVVLTGIGRDGHDGCRALADRGASILVQDEATSVVWGMPGVVAQAGLADEILPIDDIGPLIQHLTNTGMPGRPPGSPSR